MDGQLILQIIITLAMLVTSIVCGMASTRCKLEQDRRHWSVEQSIFLVGTALACIIILGGSR